PQDLAGGDVQVSEFVKVVDSSGRFGELAKEKSKVSRWQAPSVTGIMFDLNGSARNRAKPVEEHRKVLRADTSDDKMGKYKIEQNYRWYNKRVEKEPKEVKDGRVVRFSGFTVEIEADPKKIIWVGERQQKENNGAEAGVVEKDASGKKEIPI
ncbi:MAG: hypothetical protein L0312_20985, partial [Acidobacteria bacterium]|nr:hypothetical protein [Acidobacteriota bacterium]